MNFPLLFLNERGKLFLRFYFLYKIISVDSEFSLPEELIVRRKIYSREFLRSSNGNRKLIFLEETSFAVSMRNFM
jgi:hypothetical protein